MNTLLIPDSPAAEGQPPVGRLFRPRRRFLTRALGLGAGAVGLAGIGRTAPTRAAVTAVVNDATILNFALNLDYLAAEYTTFAVTGGSIEMLGIATTGANTGGGNPGAITIKASPKVPFSSPAVAQLANELAVEERRHVVFLRNTLALFGAQPAARPALDLMTSFAAIGAMVGLPNFDPFASDVNFLLGGYIIEDVALTALHGAAKLITNRNILDAAAGLLGIEGYHSAVIRTNLFQMGQGAATQAISALRASLGDSVDYGVAQGPSGWAPPATPASRWPTPGRSPRSGTPSRS